MSVAVTSIPTSIRRARLRLAGAVALVLAAVVPSLGYVAANRMDDYLITLRYARNAALGVGAVFTEGHVVQGFTSPLQFLVGLVVCLFRPGLEFPPTFICFLGLAAVVAFAVNLSLWLARGLSLGTLAVCLGLVFSSFILLAFVGFDIVWALGLLATALTVFDRGRYRTAGILSGLAILARPDAVLFAGVMFLVLLLRRDRRALWHYALPILLLVVPWILFTTFYYGSPLPHTLATKQKLGSSNHPSLNKTTFEAFTMAFTRPPLSANGIHLGAFLLLLIAFNVGWSRWVECFRQPVLQQTLRRMLVHPLTLFGSGAVLHFFAYFSILRVPPTFPWYHAYLTGFFLALYAAPAAYVARRAGAALEDVQAGRGRVARALPPAVLGMVALGWVGYAGWLHFDMIGRRDNPGQYRYNGYRGAAEWIVAHSEPTDIVTATEVGVLGWYCPRPITDTSNLVTHGITERHDFRYAVRANDRLFPPSAFIQENTTLRVAFEAGDGVTQVRVYERNPD